MLLAEGVYYGPCCTDEPLLLLCVEARSFPQQEIRKHKSVRGSFGEHD